jgi:hypothetical protein
MTDVFEYTVIAGARTARLRISKEGLVWEYRCDEGSFVAKLRVDAVLTMGPQVSFAVPEIGDAHVFRLAGRAVHDPADFEFADLTKGTPS